MQIVPHPSPDKKRAGELGLTSSMENSIPQGPASDILKY